MSGKAWKPSTEYPEQTVKLLDKVLGCLGEGVVITNTKGEILYVNAIHEKITGIPREKMINSKTDELKEQGYFSKNFTAMVMEAKRKLIRNIRLYNGKEAIIASSPIFGVNGDVELIVTAVRDITGLINLNERLESEEGRAQLYQKHLMGEQEEEVVIADSEAFREVLDFAKRFAEMDSSVLILGETGSGKEVVASHIYEHSKRKGKPYIKVNCGAIAPSLLQSELFGYVTGAFTGADPKGKIGVFEMADGGTLFLDEIGELPLELQPALLRVLDDGKVTRVGGTRAKKVDVRIIAATNRDLERMIEDGRFRSDLYYRLNTASVTVPPLRERPEDIPGLARRTVEKLNKKYGGNKVIEPDFIEELKLKKWPGNVRELENYVEKYYVLAEEGWVGESAPHAAWTRLKDTTHKDSLKQNREEGLPTYQEAKADMERRLFAEAMEQGGSTYQAAKLLGMNQSTFYRKYRAVFPEADL